MLEPVPDRPHLHRLDLPPRMKTRRSPSQNAMRHAQVEAEMSTCLKLQVGAAIYDDDWRLLATGRNGMPRGEPHCTERGCWEVDGHCMCIHAETNALLQAARTGVKLLGGRMSITHSPCHRCCGNIINAGLVAVTYLDAYPDDIAAREAGKRLTRAGIHVHRLEELL